MRVFVTGTGRCGTVTFARAAAHATNYTVGHETHTNKVIGGTLRGDILNLEYPDDHIEVSPQLVLQIPLLKQKYPDAKWVHLVRHDRDACARSLWDRSDWEAFARYWFLNTDPPGIETCQAIYDMVNGLCEDLLRGPRCFRVGLADFSHSDAWRTVWDFMGCRGDYEASTEEWSIHHNAGRPVLSILMPSLASREKTRLPLVDSILEQVRRFDDVEFLTKTDNGEWPSGRKRNWLIENSTGKYFCFVDDDDQVADDYVASLRQGCFSGADVVTFRLRYTVVGASSRVSRQIFSLRYDDHQPLLEPYTVGMRPNHLCAWRRNIGTLVRFPEHLGYNDDCFWYKPLVLSGRVKKEHHIAKELYYYRFDGNATANQTKDRRAVAYRWAGDGIECYLQADGEIFVATQDMKSNEGKTRIEVRNGRGEVLEINRTGWEPYAAIRAV